MSLLPKPKFGSPCNHCGLCCREALCFLAEEIYGKDHPAPCPALIEVNGKHLCSFAVMESKVKAEPLVKKMLGMDVGCSMSDDETTDEEIEAYRVHSLKIVQSPIHKFQDFSSEILTNP